MSQLLWGLVLYIWACTEFWGWAMRDAQEEPDA
jgi:hypothetical protein